MAMVKQGTRRKMRNMPKVLFLAAMTLLLTACPDQWDGCPQLVVHNNTQDTVYLWKQDLFINGSRSMVYKMYVMKPDDWMTYVYREDDTWAEVFDPNSMKSVKEIHLYVSKDKADYNRWTKDQDNTACYEQKMILTYEDFKNNDTDIHEITLGE